MHVDIRLLNECPVLSDYEKDLLSRIAIEGEAQINVARSYHKAPSTISIQYKKTIQKFNLWLAKRKKERTAIEQAIDKRVFAMFNQGLPPNIVVGRLGNTDEVLALWEKYRGLMEDDYIQALNKVMEYGLKVGGDSRLPLKERVDILVREHYLLSKERSQIWDLVEEKGLNLEVDKKACNSSLEAVKKLIQREFAVRSKLRKTKKTIKILRRESAMKDVRIQALMTENEKLSRLRKYETLTDAQIDARRLNLQMIENRVLEKNRESSYLNMEIYKAKCAIFSLNTEIEQAVKAYLSSLPQNELWQLIINIYMARYLETYMPIELDY